MKQPTEKPTVRLTGINGNAFSILAAIKQALKKSGADKAYIDQYLHEATSGNYDHLLMVTADYVNIQ